MDSGRATAFGLNKANSLFRGGQKSYERLNTRAYMGGKNGMKRGRMRTYHICTHGNEKLRSASCADVQGSWKVLWELLKASKHTNGSELYLTKMVHIALDTSAKIVSVRQQR